MNIEERAAVAAKKLARTLGWTKQYAIGCLYGLWHDSQEIEATHCLPEDLVDWMGIDLAQVDVVVNALIDCKLLKAEDGGRYLIRGNARHIAALRQRREAGSSGGKRSAEQRQVIPPKLKVVRDTDAQADAQAYAAPDAQAPGEPSAVLCSAASLQLNAEHNKKSAEPERRAVDLEGQIEECVETWEETLSRFGKGRKALPQERILIGRAIQTYTFKNVQLAIFGARHEPKSDSYNPKDWVSLSRILERGKEGKSMFDRFLGWGIEAQAKVDTRQGPVPTPKAEEEFQTLSPQESKKRARDIINGIKFGEVPKIKADEDPRP